MASFGLNNFPASSARVGSLMADFSGLQDLEEVVERVLTRLASDERTHSRIQMVNQGSMSVQNFDGWFAELVRVELGKTLGVMRAKAVRKAMAAGAGSASSAVLRRMYKDELGGNINISGNRRKVSSRVRQQEPPTGGVTGIRRVRYVGKNTLRYRSYYGPDRSFILRILNEGRDTYMATSYGPTGKRSKATWGKRGFMAPKSFFHTMSADMELAAQKLGTTLVQHVEKWADRQFKEK